MNPQVKRQKDGSWSRGIEWLSDPNGQGGWNQGFTSNPIGGCFHDCQWTMPDGKIAVCYAKTTAEGVAQAAYPDGFEHHYWRPAEMKKWASRRGPAKIFVDSMSDMWGHWVPDAEIAEMLEFMRQASWHTFISLTKNAPRLLKFKDRIPRNVWCLASSPPDYFMGQPLSRQQQATMLRVQLHVFEQLPYFNVIGISAEPLSWDITPILKEYAPTVRLNWMIIGAASNGDVHYQPEKEHVQNLLDLMDEWQVPVFFKGNLEWDPHREEFPR